MGSPLRTASTVLPCGTEAGISQYALRRDEELNPEPDKYNADRFYTMNAPAEERCQNSLGTTGDKYMVFGHSRRQCPGRRIVVHIFKVFMAEMLLNYDIQSIPIRPKIQSGCLSFPFPFRFFSFCLLSPGGAVVVVEILC